jgi:hypothetical protein
MLINDMHHEDPDAIADVDMIYFFTLHRPLNPDGQPEPGEPLKGFWIRVGHFFRIHTKYTDYVNQQKTHEQYLKDMDNWRKSTTYGPPNGKRKSRPQSPIRRELSL